MDAILVFIVGVAVRMIDPLTLLMAAVAAAATTQIQSNQGWWLVVCVGAGVVVAVSAIIVSTYQSRSGLTFRFNWLSAMVAAFMQVLLISLAIAAWRKRTQKNG